MSRRKVLRVAAAYIVIAWVLMQVASLLEETLELPNWFDKFSFAILLLGFPVALMLSWAYDVRPDESQGATTSSTGRFAFATIIMILLLGSVGLTYYVFRETTPPTVASQSTPSIAVLPFADMSPGGDQAWFADGVSEEILNVLAKTEGLQVASRTASFRYRGDDIDIKSAATELNVTTVLEGSIRSQGDQLRITAQLINAEDGFHLWSDSFDRKLSDIFVVQDEISANIATALFGELGIEALPANRFKGTESIEAYSFYLRGREKLNAFDVRNSAVAIPDFEQAVALDPQFADAWAGLARAERARNLAEQRPPSKSTALMRALALDPENADAIGALAHFNYGSLRWLEAEQLYHRAISIEPDNAFIQRRFGSFLRNTGRTQQALDQFLLARQLGSTGVTLFSDIVNTYAYLGRFSEARRYFEEERSRVGLEGMMGTEAYFVSMLADGMETEARKFASEKVLPDTSRARMQFFLNRLDDDPQAAARLIEATYRRIEDSNAVRWGDIDNFLMAGEVELARSLLPRTLGYGWSIPSRFIMHINEQIDPRYLPYRPNLLLLVDNFPGVPEAFMDIGVDVMARAREKGFIE